MATSRNPRALTLQANFSWAFAGNVVYASCQWGMLMVLAQLGSPEVVGQYALGLAITAPVFMLCNLQLRAVLATDANRDYQFSDYLRLRFMTTALALLTVAAIVVLTEYQRQTLLIILAVSVTKSIESISDIVYGYLQQQERMDRISHSMMLRGAAAIVTIWAGVNFSGSVLIGIIGMAVAWLLVLVAFDLPGISQARQGSVTIEPIPKAQLGFNYWLSLLRLALVAAPLGIVLMLLSLNVNIPQYVIQSSLGERSVGIFAAIAYLVVVGNTVVSALAQSATPRLAQYFLGGDIKQFRHLMKKLIVIGAALGSAGIFVAAIAGRPVLALLFGPDYAAASDVLTWMLTAAAISYVASFLCYGLTAARQFRVQAPLFAVVTSVTAAACFVLIPFFGLIGAAWATILGAIAQLIGSGAILRGAMRDSAGHFPGEP